MTGAGPVDESDGLRGEVPTDTARAVARGAAFRYLQAVDPTFVRLSLLWLLGIVATPFLTEVLREGDLDVVRFGLYALAQGLLLLVASAMQWVAGRHGLFVPGTPDDVVRPVWWRELAPAAGFLVSVPLYPLLGSWAFALWVLVPNLPTLAGWIRPGAGAARSRRGTRPPRSPG